jgi:TetR/AcrR family transcriptional repressor of mexJK operon
MASDEENRTTRKRRVILAAATDVFLRNGYLGTSMDQVAALAAVSKQTVYKHFADKERLFADIVSAVTDQVDEALRDQAVIPARTDDVAKGLLDIARRFVAGIMDPHVLQVRRLIIAEAERFPELGRLYYERGFERGIATLAANLGQFADRGLLRLPDPLLAANHFAGMLLWIPMNKVMFQGQADGVPSAESERLAEAAVSAFLAAYGTD